MSKVHLARSGFITKAALPSITRQRGTTTATSDLMLFGAGKTTVANNTTFIDSSTNAFTVTRNGDTVHSGHNPFSTVSDGSAYFDGSGDSLSIADNTALEFGSNEFCIEGWCYPTSSSGYGVLITKRPTSAADWIIYRELNSFQIRFAASSNGTTYDIVNSLPFGTMNSNAWNHFAVYRVVNAWYGALNGSVTTLNASNSSALTNNTSPVTIGSDVTSNVLTGYLSNIRLVKGSSVYTSANFTPPTSALTAITNTQLLLLTDNYSIVNSTPTPIPITISGNTTISTAQYPTGMTRSIYFDGTGDYLTTSNNAALSFGTNNFTIEFFGRIASYGANGGNFISNTSDNLNFFYSTSGLLGYWNGSAATNSTQTAPLNTWFHFAAVRSGTTIKLYYDGTEIFSQTEARNLTSNNIVVGQNGSVGTFNLNGYMSNIRISNGTAVYTANFTAPSAPLSVNISVPANVTNAIYGVNQLA